MLDLLDPRLGEPFGHAKRARWLVEAGEDEHDRVQLLGRDLRDEIRALASERRTLVRRVHDDCGSSVRESRRPQRASRRAGARGSWRRRGTTARLQHTSAARHAAPRTPARRAASPPATKTAERNPGREDISIEEVVAVAACEGVGRRSPSRSAARSPTAATRSASIAPDRSSWRCADGDEHSGNDEYDHRENPHVRGHARAGGAGPRRRLRGGHEPLERLGHALSRDRCRRPNRAGGAGLAVAASGSKASATAAHGADGPAELPRARVRLEAGGLPRRGRRTRRSSASRSRARRRPPTR